MFRLSLINADPAQQRLAAQAAVRLRGVEVSAEAALPDVDAAWIVGPVAERAACAARTAQSGKPVLVEMPAAESFADLEQTIQECAAAGVKLMVASPLRFRPSIAAVKSALDSGKLGQTALLRAHSWQPRTNEPAGDLGPTVVQYLDLAVWMFGSRPTEIFSLGRAPVAHDRGWPEYMQIHLGFPQGGMALLTFSEGLPEGDDYESLSVVGSSGAVYADDHYQTQLLYRGQQPLAVKAPEELMTTTAVLREFVAMVTQNREPNGSGADARTALQLAAAAHHSLLAGQPVHWQELRDVVNR